mmetsp:Transcript_3019/g.4370  ORF Transcript_3019/g.4370 Transcript_3019/m.4370 type:complete len:170 (-) Transcript_3019:289-798(-)
MIDMGCNPKGEPYNAYMKRRWGGDGWTYSMRRAASPDGIQFGNWKTWPNTFLAHRLLTHVLTKFGPASQHVVKEAIFLRVYEKGQNVSDPKVLLDIAKECKVEEGLGEAVLSYTSKDALGNQVLEEDQTAKNKLGIDGVPFFRFPDGTTFSGAQPTHVFQRLLENQKKK